MAQAVERVREGVTDSQAALTTLDQGVSVVRDAGADRGADVALGYRANLLALSGRLDEARHQLRELQQRIGSDRLDNAKTVLLHELIAQTSLRQRGFVPVWVHWSSRPQTGTHPWAHEGRRQDLAPTDPTAGSRRLRPRLGSGASQCRPMPPRTTTSPSRRPARTRPKRLTAD